MCGGVYRRRGAADHGLLFHCKDEGSSQTSYRRASFQGFSIRAGDPVPLPGGISALRCERGPHDPDASHLFARLFYQDCLDEEMTLERLGFSAGEAALFAEIWRAMRGGIFIGGRACDGKSTTLAVNLAPSDGRDGAPAQPGDAGGPGRIPHPGRDPDRGADGGRRRDPGGELEGGVGAFLPGESSLRNGLGNQVSVGTRVRRRSAR